jgi:hypothetical protein
LGSVSSVYDVARLQTCSEFVLCRRSCHHRRRRHVRRGAAFPVMSSMWLGFFLGRVACWEVL